MDWMKMAIREAEKAIQEGEVPVGAVLVYQDQVIASAHNCRENDCDPTAHAEILCLREGAKKMGTWRMRNCTLYVTLEPCPMCAGAMVVSQLTKCVFGAYDRNQGCCGSVYDLPADPALHGTTLWQGGVEAEQCEKLLTDFFKTMRTPAGGKRNEENRNDTADGSSAAIHAPHSLCRNVPG